MEALRGEGMATRRERLAKLKKGPGVFVYDGESVDTEWIPTVKRAGKKSPVLSADGMPVVDSSGRQIYEPPNQIVRDISGRPVLGGVPKVNLIPIKTQVVQGVSFPAGEQVSVKSHALALKLRCMSHFSEVEPGEEHTEEIEKPKRGRPRKAEKVDEGG